MIAPSLPKILPETPHGTMQGQTPSPLQKSCGLLLLEAGSGTIVTRTRDPAGTSASDSWRLDLDWAGLEGWDGWAGWAGWVDGLGGRLSPQMWDTTNHTFSHLRMQTTWNHSKCNGDNVSTSRFPIDLRLCFCIPKQEEGSPVSGVASMSPREDTQAVTTAMRESYMLVTHAHDGCLALCHGTTWLDAHVIEATQAHVLKYLFLQCSSRSCREGALPPTVSATNRYATTSVEARPLNGRKL